VQLHGSFNSVMPTPEFLKLAGHMAQGVEDFASSYQGSLRMTLGIRVFFGARPPHQPRARYQVTWAMSHHPCHLVSVWNGLENAAEFTWEEASSFVTQIWHTLENVGSSASAIGVIGSSPTSAGFVSLDPAALASIKNSHF